MKDREIVKMVLLLTGSIQGTKKMVNDLMDKCISFKWLWKDSIEQKLRKFKAKKPIQDEYEEELRKYEQVEDEIEKIEDVGQIGAMVLKTKGVKEILKGWIKEWKLAYLKDFKQTTGTELVPDASV